MYFPYPAHSMNQGEFISDRQAVINNTVAWAVMVKLAGLPGKTGFTELFLQVENVQGY